jgi:glucoamylase
VALERGARWLVTAGDAGRARRCAEAARALEPAVAAFWCDQRRLYRSRGEPDGESPKARDMSVILGVLHAGRDSGAFSIADERVHSTMARLEEMFAADYALNRGRARPFAFGRYRGDRYFSGGAWYLCSFAAAEYYYRLAGAARAGAARWAPKAVQSLARGDEIMAAVRRYVPASGEISEQFDQTTGAQTSAKNLTWSYAAFITAAAARRAALARAA